MGIYRPYAKLVSRDNLQHDNNKKQTLKKRATCKNCKKSLKSSRNKIYCSIECRQIASRKISNHSVKALVKNDAWRKVERAISSSPLGLNSINNKNDLVELCLCFYFEKKYYNNIFRAYHIIPPKLYGSNSLSNIIIAPSFIKRSDNIALSDQLNEICINKQKKSKYIIKSIIDTYLSCHEKDKLENLLEQINQLFDVNNGKNAFLNFKSSINEKCAFESYFSFSCNIYLKKSYFEHAFVQIAQKLELYPDMRVPFLPIFNLCNMINKNKVFINEHCHFAFDLYYLIGLYVYIFVLNFSKKEKDFCRDLEKKLNNIFRKPVEKLFKNLCETLMLKITPFIKNYINKQNAPTMQMECNRLKLLGKKYIDMPCNVNGCVKRGYKKITDNIKLCKAHHKKYILAKKSDQKILYKDFFKVI